MLRRQGFALISGALALCLVGCDGCKDEPRVPFKLGDGKPAPEGKGAVDKAAHARIGSAASSAYAAGTTSITVENAKLVRNAGSFRAALAVDLDTDGARDALILATDPEGRPMIESALRKDATLYLQDSTLALASGFSHCRVNDAQIGALGPELTLVSIDLGCAAENAPQGAPPESDAPPVPVATELAQSEVAWTMHAVVSTEASPRMLLKLAQRKATSDLLELAITGEDLDADEHTDLRVSVQLMASGGDPVQLSLAWMNRPSGLARQSAEPEQTLSTLATAASQFLPKNPASALTAAERVLLLHRLLCRESGQAELIVDDEPGLGCGPSSAAGRAAVTATIGHARARELFPSFDAFAALDSPAYRVDNTQKDRARRALALIVGDTDFTWYDGPEHHAPTVPNVRLPALGFLEETRLLLRGSSARSYDVITHELATVSAPSSVIVQDLQSRFAVVDFLRACDGVHLRVVPAAQVIGNMISHVSQVTASDPLLEVATGNDTHCEEPVRSVRTGMQVLGFTARGVLVAKGATLSLVPLDAAGAPAGMARVLPVGEPAPPLLLPGALSSDGLRHALATSEGVALVDRSSAGRTRLVRSPPSCTGTPSDVALSASGTRIAMLCGGRVYYAQSKNAPEPPPTAAVAAVPLPEAAPPTGQPRATATAAVPPPSQPPVPSAPKVEDLPPPAPEH